MAVSGLPHLRALTTHYCRHLMHRVFLFFKLKVQGPSRPRLLAGGTSGLVTFSFKPRLERLDCIVLKVWRLRSSQPIFLKDFKKSASAFFLAGCCPEEKMHTIK